ncbi:hypothetical protein RAZWK3B_00525 [Roseobacter sp. AzwK-3b]|nr:hypothetical protein RAZWK3B_00525 [Roseobacter sp. AzwK-3b]
MTGLHAYIQPFFDFVLKPSYAVGTNANTPGKFPLGFKPAQMLWAIARESDDLRDEHEGLRVVQVDHSSSPFSISVDVGENGRSIIL